MKAIINEITRLAESRRAELCNASKRGACIVEYEGTYIPAELIRAAGAEPYFSLRGGDMEAAMAALEYQVRFMNPLARSIAGSKLLEKDSVSMQCRLTVLQQTDNHSGRVAEILEFSGAPVAVVEVPEVFAASDAAKCYGDSIRNMVKAVEEVTTCEADYDRARALFEQSNKVNLRLRKVNELRKLGNPPIGFTEVIRLNHSSFVIDSDELCRRLDDLYEELVETEGVYLDNTPRLLLCGRAVAPGDYAVIDLIEDSGAVIVAELLDEGIRFIENDVDVDADDLVGEYVRCRYSTAIPVSSMQHAWEVRANRIRELIAEYNINGIVWYQLMFDEIYDIEYDYISDELRGCSIPILKIETSYEYTSDTLGTLETRIESFIEGVRANMV